MQFQIHQPNNKRKYKETIQENRDNNETKKIGISLTELTHNSHRERERDSSLATSSRLRSSREIWELLLNLLRCCRSHSKPKEKPKKICFTFWDGGALEILPKTGAGATRGDWTTPPLRHPPVTTRSLAPSCCSRSSKLETLLSLVVFALSDLPNFLATAQNLEQRSIPYGNFVLPSLLSPVGLKPELAKWSHHVAKTCRSMCDAWEPSRSSWLAKAPPNPT